MGRKIRPPRQPPVHPRGPPRRGPEAAADALYAFGALDAIGFSPFSIENTPDPTTNPLARAYALLHGLAALILEHQGRGTIAGVRPPVSFTGVVNDSAQTVVLGSYALRVSNVDPFSPGGTTADHGALIIALTPDEFLVAGTGVPITFEPRGPGAPIAGILDVQEGRYENGRSRAPRRTRERRCGARRSPAWRRLAARRRPPVGRGGGFVVPRRS
ncbi:MAG: DUF5597 domain-containing protein [Gemmatimonadetes bacterium]|nr:DUF5597 domain-containing protein [Gemmatimonadota bacterium]